MSLFGIVGLVLTAEPTCGYPERGQYTGGPDATHVSATACFAFNVWPKTSLLLL